jgi:hypothetical protein
LHDEFYFVILFANIGDFSEISDKNRALTIANVKFLRGTVFFAFLFAVD